MIFYAVGILYQTVSRKGLFLKFDLHTLNPDILNQIKKWPLKWIDFLCLYLTLGPLRYLEDYYDRDQSSFDMASQQDMMSARSDRSSSRSHTASPQLHSKLTTRQPTSDTENSSQKKSGSPVVTRKQTQFNTGSEPMPTAEEKQVRQKRNVVCSLMLSFHCYSGFRL